ncbi:MAG TPA: NADH-quinone oxidoreductase subunit NuoE [Firmicutes bacterium]|nr:NADH-quinone oxidoreductase subunit NuoE [Bacillota bacterium]HHY97338.1 NADH-quinone oxidoreductase subunit NuoE [Bacillota bacterium]
MSQVTEKSQDVLGAELEEHAGGQAGTRQRLFEKVNEILSKYDREPSALISILQEVQAEYRYLPEEIMTYIATALGIPPSKVFGVATFYAQFSLEPQGRYVIRMCDGTACHVRGSSKVLQAVRKKLGLSGKETTTSDMQFTIETVSCLGACGLAPVVMVNDRVYGQMTPEKVDRLLDELMSNSGDDVNAQPQVERSEAK